MPSPKSKPKPRPEPLTPHAEWSFEAIGTQWWIGVYEPITHTRLVRLQREVAVRIETFDMKYSRFRADSLVTQIAQQAGEYRLPEDAEPLLAFYRQLYDATAGRVTPLIGQTLSDAGYGANYSLKPGVLHEPPRWDAAMTYRGGLLTTQQTVLLDFGAAGKGYLVDIIANLLQSAGVGQLCVDAGGDMYCVGLGTPLRIGLENPDDPSQVVGVAELSRGALCGSAGNRRAWGDYHHIIDPKLLISPRHIKALWVTADDALTADGLATALFFTTPEVLRKTFTFEQLILYADGSAAASPGFAAQLFT